MLAPVLFLSLFASIMFAQTKPNCSVDPAPTGPVTVSMNGFQYTPKSVILKLDNRFPATKGEPDLVNVRLNFRSEDKYFPQQEAGVGVIGVETKVLGAFLDGKTFRLLSTDDMSISASDPSLPPPPKPVLPRIMNWGFQNSDDGFLINQVSHRASIRLEFGTRTGNTIRGSIRLCVPKSQKALMPGEAPLKADSIIEGTFEAQIR
jgi:hypothetical protein